MNCILSALSLALLALSPSLAHAAKAPASLEKLHAISSHVIIGQVIAVDSDVTASDQEASDGSLDEIYTIKIKIVRVVKGEDIKMGDVITVTAWSPRQRIGIAQFGNQGHELIPKVGAQVTCFLTKKGDRYEPYMPNGIQAGDVLKAKD